MSLCIDDCLVCRFGWVSSKPAQQTVIYTEWDTPDVVLIQVILLMMHQVGHLQRLYRDARSTEHSIHSPSWLQACCNQYDDIHVTNLPTYKRLRSFKFTTPAVYNAKWTTHSHFTQVPCTIYYPVWRRKSTTFIQVMPFKLKPNNMHLQGQSHKTQQFYHTQSLHLARASHNNCCAHNSDKKNTLYVGNPLIYTTCCELVFIYVYIYIYIYLI